MPNFGAPELILILVIVMVLFGWKKLPEMARSIGKSSKEFKKGLAESDAEDAKADPKAEASPEEPVEKKTD